MSTARERLEEDMEDATEELLRERDNTAQEATDTPKLRLRSASEIVSHPISALWLLRPYLEQLVLAVIYGELGTLKSFVTLDMLLHIAAGKRWADSTFVPKAQPVVYVSAEGKGLAKRLRAWAIQHGVDLETLPFYAVEHALDLSSPDGVTELAQAIQALEVQPGIVAIDTLSRNCGPLDENSSADMSGYINALDLHLRQSLQCSVLLVHHVGHAAKDRARGAYALMGSTDANYRIERPDPGQLLIKLTTGRLKDSESPSPLFLQAHVVDLGTADEDGQPETSLVLMPTSERPTEPKRRPTGKQQAALLRLLEEEQAAGNAKVWTQAEIRQMARERIGMHRNSARDSVVSLTASGYLVATVNGLALAEPPEAQT